MFESNIADAQLVTMANHLKRLREVLKNILETNFDVSDTEMYLSERKIIVPFITYKPQQEIHYELVFRDDEIRMRPSLSSESNIPTESLFVPDLFSMELDIVTNRFISTTKVEDISYINNSLNLITDKMITGGIITNQTTDEILTTVMNIEEEEIEEELTIDTDSINEDFDDLLELDASEQG